MYPIMTVKSFTCHYVGDDDDGCPGCPKGRCSTPRADGDLIADEVDVPILAGVSKHKAMRAWRPLSLEPHLKTYRFRGSKDKK